MEQYLILKMSLRKTPSYFYISIFRNIYISKCKGIERCKELRHRLSGTILLFRFAHLCHRHTNHHLEILEEFKCALYLLPATVGLPISNHSELIHREVSTKERHW